MEQRGLLSLKWVTVSNQALEGSPGEGGWSGGCCWHFLLDRTHLTRPRPRHLSSGSLTALSYWPACRVPQGARGPAPALAEPGANLNGKAERSGVEPALPAPGGGLHFNGPSSKPREQGTGTEAD